MTVVEETPKAPERPSSKELRELGRKMKAGFRWERTGSGHYRVRDRSSNTLVEFRGRPIQVSQEPSPGSLRAIEEQLTEARVLRGTKMRPVTDEGAKRRREAHAQMHAERTARRQAEADALYGRMEKIIGMLGGHERGAIADIGAAARQLSDFQTRFTPDLLTSSLYRIANKGWVEPRYQEVWTTLADHLEASDEPVEELFRLMRIGKGLPEHVQIAPGIKPTGENAEWPYRVELLPLDRLLVDHTYQRPVDWPWVRKTASTYDDTLVGTIDVAERRPGAAYAVMDGQGRFEVLKMVGKTTVHASIYTGLDVESEARFFLHKNQDRKAVHPYHIYKAKLTARTPETLTINQIVESFGYVMSITSASKLDNKISAISGVEEAYRRKSETRDECLSPTLALLKETTFERKQGQAAMLIKGTARFFQVFSDEQIDRVRLAEVYRERGAEWLLGRSREETSSNGAQLRAFVFVIVGEHNRGKSGSDRLRMPALGHRG